MGTVGVTINGRYLQYRTYENAANDQYRGWVDLSKDGIPGEVSDYTKVELKNSAGTVVNNAVDVNSLWTGPYYFGRWNSTTSSVDYSGPSLSSGYSVRFPAGDLPAGNYTYEVTTSEGDIVSDTFNFPGIEELPFALSATMSNEWLVGNSLKLTWSNPVGDYDQIRIFIYDDDTGSDVLYVNLPPTAEELTIPAEWIEVMGDFYDLGDNVLWQVQTRSYTDDGVNYARGLSNMVYIQD